MSSTTQVHGIAQSGFAEGTNDLVRMLCCAKHH